jgi:flagellar assembly factor FliW
MSTMGATTQGDVETIAVRSQALGGIEVPAADAIRFHEPIPGFADCVRYALVPHVRADGAPDTGVMWLQALDVPYHAFIVTDPWSVVADYAPEIPDADAEQLRLKTFEDARVMVILTVPRQGDVTVNLRAPIVVNQVERLAKQVVLLSDQYGTRHALNG